MCSALAWAEDTAVISRDEALLQLKRTLLLTGVDPSDGQASHLAFAPFAVFALHCFTAHALLHAPLEEDLFEEVRARPPHPKPCPGSFPA